jgi:7-carboxy-7-deazaguanine synthase
VPVLRLNEHYTSVQGEGPNVGILTQFVRFSGCNMRCPGWPCDTPHAIEPALWKNDPKVTAHGVIAAICREMASTGAKHVCLTGGEPFLQDHAQLRDIVLGLQESFTFDIFTNGSFLFPIWAARPHVTIVLDWKLRGSGEAETKLEERMINARTLHQKDAIKFTVKDQFDLDRAADWWFDIANDRPEVYVGRVWGEITDAHIVEFIKKTQLPWRLNIQTHKLIWPNEERGI